MKLAVVELLCLASTATATGPIPVQRSGLAGVDGFTFYNSYCGHACYRSFSPFTLPCSKTIMTGGHATANEMAQAIALCRASNFSLPELHRMAFWETQITGDVTVRPRWSYGETMANITKPPTMVLTGKGELNMTVITTTEVLNVTENTLIYFFNETAVESVYGIVTCVVIFALPVALTWLGYLPFMTRVLDRIKPYLYPSVMGTYHDRPLPFLLGNAPTIGQALFITLMVILNVVFISVNYKTLFPGLPMQWYDNHYQELMFYVCLRTGVMAFCLMPVMFLFSSRNNILPWMTNWSHSTYLLLHRWVARIFLVQALLHSILALVLWVKTDNYVATLPMEFWIWGCVATVAAVMLVLASVLVLRRRAYELFLAVHVVLAVVFVVGCWYHIYHEYEYEYTFGYESWLYATIAVWFFDRLVRVLRLLKSGIRYSTVSDVGSRIVRVDITGIRWAAAPGHRVHVYFPTLKPLCPWENHPFSMVPTAMLAKREYNDHARSAASGDVDDTPSNGVTEGSEEKIGHNYHHTQQPYTSAGLTLFIRKTAGLTSYLKEHARLLTLVEGPYPNNATKPVLQSDRLLLIGGGIGITGLLSFLGCHQNIKLFFSVKETDQCLMDALGTVLGEVREKDLVVGRRLAIDALLREEASIA